MRQTSFCKAWAIGRTFVCVLTLMLIVLAGATWAAPPQSGPVFGPISFSTDLEWQTEQVLSSGHKFPEGVLYLCAYWTYRDAVPGASYNFTWYHGGSVVETGQVTLPSASGEAKLYMRGAEGFGPAPGIYTLVLEMQGQTFVSNPPAMIEPTDLGGGGTARCGPLQFRRGYSESSTRIMMGGTRYAQGTKEVLAAWTCRDMRVGAPFRVTWTQDDKTFYTDEDNLEYDMTGFFASLTNPAGSPLAAGVYRLTFTVEGQVWLAGEVTVEGLGGFSTQPYFGQPAFWPEFNEAQHWPINVGSEFNQGIENIYLFWPYRDVTVNTPLKVTWYHDGKFFAQQGNQFERSQGIYWVRNYFKEGAALGPGVYRAVVEMNGEIVLADACAILPVESGPSSSSQTTETEFGAISFASAVNRDIGEPLIQEQF